MADERNGAKDEAAALFESLVRRRDLGGDAVRRLAELDGAAQVLESRTADADPEVRRLAVRALAARGERSTIAPLLNAAAALRDAGTDEAAIALRGAVTSLTPADAPKVVAFLASFADHSDPFVRSTVADGLARVAAADQVGTLLRLATDRDAFVAERAVRALDALGYSPPTPPPDAPPTPSPDGPPTPPPSAVIESGARVAPRSPPRARPKAVGAGPLRPPRIPDDAPLLLQEPPETFIESSGDLRRVRAPKE